MVTISKYYSSVTKKGVKPSNPGNVVTVIPEVLNPADSPVSHSPVTIGSPANGLSLAGQVLSLGLSSAGVTGALSGTDWSTFNLKIAGSIASGQVAFGTGAGTVGGSNNLFWDNTNGRLGIGITTPTNTLDVNGTVRIRQMSNAVGNFLTLSATNVIQERTAAEARVDLGVVLSVVAGTGIFIGGTAVNPSVFLTGQALSFHSLGGTGFVYRTSGVVGVRTITAGAGITVTNGDGVAGNPVISAAALAKFAYTSSFTITSTYQNIPTSVGSNSFVSSDIPNGQLFQLDLTISDMRGSGGGTGSILFIKIFGREYQITFPTPIEITELHNLSFFIQGGSGTDSDRSISTKIIKSSGSVYLDPVPYYVVPATIGYTDTVNLSTSKTIEIKTIISNSGPILQFAKFYRVI